MRPIIDQDEWNYLELKVQIYCRTKKARKKNIKKALQLLHRVSCIGTLDNPIVSLTMPIHKNVEFANSYNRNHRRYSDKAYKEIIKSLERITAKENFSFEGETSYPLNTPTPSFGLRTLYKLENNEVKDMIVTGVGVIK